MAIKNCYHNVYNENSKSFRLNPCRLLQAIISAACFIYTIILLNNTDVSEDIPGGYLYILIVTSSICFLLTILDLIGMIYGRPFPWGSWLLIATAGFLLCCSCVGMLISTEVNTELAVIIAVVLFALLAILFIIDIICLLYYIAKRKTFVSDEKPATVDAFTCTDPPEEPKVKCSCAKVKKQQQQQQESKQPVQKSNSTSYGGTFPMSKNEPPLPSPEDKRRTSRSSAIIQKNQRICNPANCKKKGDCHPIKAEVHCYRICTPDKCKKKGDCHPTHPENNLEDSTKGRSSIAKSQSQNIPTQQKSIISNYDKNGSNRSRTLSKSASGIQEEPKDNPQQQPPRGSIRSVSAMSHQSKNVSKTGSINNEAKQNSPSKIIENEREVTASHSSRTVNLSNQPKTTTSQPNSPRKDQQQKICRDCKSAGATCTVQEQQFYCPYYQQYHQYNSAYTQYYSGQQQQQQPQQCCPQYVVATGPVICSGKVITAPRQSVDRPTQVADSLRNISAEKSRISVENNNSGTIIYNEENNPEIHRTGCDCCLCQPEEVEDEEPVQKENDYYPPDVLDSISEVDCETDSNVRMSESTSEEFVRKEQNTDVQTSETRMITAKELERMNLPGTVVYEEQ